LRLVGCRPTFAGSNLRKADIVKFHPTPLHGAYTIELEKRGDDRGFFARFFCQKEFEAAGVPMTIVQINNSLSAKAGTLRGMHYQLAPAAEIKVVRCIRGALYDAIVDLRPDSPTYGQWTAVELKATPGAPSRMLYVPEGFAHGFQTLEDDTEVLYQMSEFYAPSAARGFRWNDPRFGIEWPEPVRVISDRDRSYPDFAVSRQTVA
jgi:dTDP-4-dehydrorhamnose 3,5-epimerase